MRRDNRFIVRLFYKNNHDNDDISTDSTISSVHVNTKKTKKRSKPTFTKRAAVSFDCNRNQIHNNDAVLNEDDIENLWYSRSERHEMKEKAREIMSVLVDDDDSTYQHVVEKLWDASHQDDMSTTSTVSGPTEKRPVPALLLSAHEQKLLSNTDGLVGLETRTSFRINEERRIYREEYVSAVMDIQQTQYHLNHDEKSERIRQACQSVSRPCVAFARCIAEC